MHSILVEQLNIVTSFCFQLDGQGLRMVTLFQRRHDLNVIPVICRLGAGAGPEGRRCVRMQCYPCRGVLGRAWWGRGAWGRGWARDCWSESVSLLSVHVCSDDLRLAGQTAHGQALGGYRLCIHMLSLLSKAVHSPRRVVYFVRISFAKLPTHK